MQLRQAEIEEMINDPAFAVWALFGVEMDAPQSARLKMMWFCRSVLDFSGIATGKSETVFFYSNLRALLLPQGGPRLLPPRIEAVYYISGEIADRVFWEKYQKYFDSKDARLFRDQFPYHRGRRKMGDISIDGCKKRICKNGNQVWLPSAGFNTDAQTQASSRFSGMVIDEFAEIDLRSKGVNKQLISRVNMPVYNAHHPVWCQKIHFLGHAEDKHHPAYRRVVAHRRLIWDGSHKEALFTCNFRDFSEAFAFMIEGVKETARAEKLLLDKAEFDAKWHGMWGVAGANWYGRKTLDACGFPGLRPRWGRHEDEGDGVIYTLGWDTSYSSQQTADFTSGVVTRAERLPERIPTPPGGWGVCHDAGGDRWVFSFPWAVRYRNRTSNQSADLIRKMHAVWLFELLVMDAGGGGAQTAHQLRDFGELRFCRPEEWAEYQWCLPIVTFYQRSAAKLAELWGPTYQRSNSGPIEFGHRSLRKAVTDRYIRWPRPMREELSEGGEEISLEARVAWQALETMVSELAAIQVMLDKEGQPKMESGFLKFGVAGTGKKDLAMAAMYSFGGALSLINKPVFVEDDVVMGV